MPGRAGRSRNRRDFERGPDARSAKMFCFSSEARAFRRLWRAISIKDIFFSVLPPTPTLIQHSSRRTKQVVQMPAAKAGVELYIRIQKGFCGTIYPSWWTTFRGLFQFGFVQRRHRQQVAGWRSGQARDRVLEVDLNDRSGDNDCNAVSSALRLQIDAA